MTREDLERREVDILAPWACRSALSLGRRHPEAEHDLRTAFQRDKDRIIHSAAFRRLEYKTQVFVNHEGDHYRTRLTHSLEVSQIGRTLARSLRLNEDLAEAVAMGHDLGHTPFGHAAERTLNGLMTEHGGFEHKAQGLRVVEILEERYPDFPGLNLTAEVREGILKGSTPYRGQTPPVPDGWALTLEAQVVDMADEIAYNAHDVDDGLERGYLAPQDLQACAFWREHIWPATAGLADAPGKLRLRAAVRKMIDMQVGDLVRESRDRIAARGFRSLEDVRVRGHDVIAFSEEMTRLNAEMKDFLMKHLYRHFMVQRMMAKAQRMVSALFEVYTTDATQLPPSFREMIGEETIERVACDYLAGMTDRYAAECYKDHFIPFLHL